MFGTSAVGKAEHLGTIQAIPGDWANRLLKFGTAAIALLLIPPAAVFAGKGRARGRRRRPSVQQWILRVPRASPAPTTLHATCWNTRPDVHQPRYCRRAPAGCTRRG